MYGYIQLLLYVKFMQLIYFTIVLIFTKIIYWKLYAVRLLYLINSYLVNFRLYKSIYFSLYIYILVNTERERLKELKKIAFLIAYLIYFYISNKLLLNLFLIIRIIII